MTRYVVKAGEDKVSKGTHDATIATAGGSSRSPIRAVASMSARNPAFEVKEDLYVILGAELEKADKEPTPKNLADAVRAGLGSKQVRKLRAIARTQGEGFLYACMPDEVADAVLDSYKKS